MSNNIIQKKGSVYSIIGEGTRFRGEFDLAGLLRIEGDFQGIIRTKGEVWVSRNGRAECNINAGTALIGGLVRGDIFASEKVEILSSGMMIGNIQTPRLIIHENVIFHGKCKITKKGLDKDKKKNKDESDIFTPIEGKQSKEYAVVSTTSGIEHNSSN